ncbi:MAG: hypothetical protein BWY63_02993 [Chloroflexi bacterium ADurb.Bin360]|nr:MAG: hypothetical protein BWY63_02993 [Chloroflexi bacterium ADurb.Bin360]
MFQLPQKPRDLAQITRIKRREGHTFAAFGGHVETVIPICTLKPDDVVFTYIEEDSEVLYKQML